MITLHWTALLVVAGVGAIIGGVLLAIMAKSGRSSCEEDNWQLTIENSRLRRERDAARQQSRQRERV